MGGTRTRSTVMMSNLNMSRNMTRNMILIRGTRTRPTVNLAQRNMTVNLTQRGFTAMKRDRNLAQRGFLAMKRGFTARKVGMKIQVANDVGYIQFPNDRYIQFPNGRCRLMMIRFLFDNYRIRFDFDDYCIKFDDYCTELNLITIDSNQYQSDDL